MSDQIPLFVEDYLDAIRATVQALGGFKRVGADMRPDLAVEAAGRWLSDCCSTDRREKLDLTQLGWLRRQARQANVHILATFEMRDAGYADPQPVEPEDERAALQREFIQHTKQMEALVKRITTMGGAANA